MWSMWDAPSDRDYYEQFNPMPLEDDPDEDPALTAETEETVAVKIERVYEEPGEDLPF